MASFYLCTFGALFLHFYFTINIARYIKSNLRLPVKIYANKNGETSIQITSLKKILNKKEFKNIHEFASFFDVEITGSGKNAKLDDSFKVYMFMDTDDCSPAQKEDYISGKMFSNHWLKNNIVPIYNNHNLEHVLCKAGIMHKRIQNDEKSSYYAKVFPICDKNNAGTKYEIIKKFRDPLLNIKPKPSEFTNMYEMIDQLIDLSG